MSEPVQQTTPERRLSVCVCDDDGMPVVVLPITAEQYARLAKLDGWLEPPRSGFELSNVFAMPAPEMPRAE